jgi:putative sterol carrier protein
VGICPAGEQGPKGHYEPVGAEVVGAPPAHHERRRPADEAVDRLPQLGAPRGEGIHDGVALLGQLPFDYPGGLEVPEAVGEQVRGHAGEALDQLAVAGGSDQQLADDEQIPAVTYYIERPGEAAELAVASTHTRTLQLKSCVRISSTSRIGGGDADVARQETKSMTDNPRRVLDRDARKGSAMVPAATHSGAPDTLAQARAALREVVPRLVGLVSSVPDANSASVGTWTVGDVAAHLSHVFRADTDAMAGRPVPEAIVTKAGIAEATAKILAEDPERDPAVLADRMSVLATEFDAVASRSRSATLDWLQGTRLPSSAVACHLLNECLIHGHDIAKATGRPWPIQRHHALLAIEAFVMPLIAALPPTAFVNQEQAASFRARIELRLRGGRRTVMVFDRGSLTLDAGRALDADAHISADPPTFMLVFIGRQGILKPLLEGKLTAWGPRPWKLARMLTIISPP